MKNINFIYEKHGCNIITFHNEEKEIHVSLEYNLETGKFNAFSDYSITKQFVYRGRCYDRTKVGNRDIYIKVLRMVKPFLKEAINKYFK